jgi:hypothetical protein
MRRLTKMLKNMNLIKFVVNKKFCESCIVIKQKFESHKNIVIFNKHFLNLIWSDFVESFVLNNKINISWRFYAILSSDQWFMCFVSNQIRLKFSDIFNCIMSIRIIKFDVFARTEEKNTQTTNSTIIALNMTLNENQSY